MKPIRWYLGMGAQAIVGLCVFVLVSCSKKVHHGDEKDDE